MAPRKAKTKDFEQTLSQERIRNLFNYDPITGNLSWNNPEAPNKHLAGRLIRRTNGIKYLLVTYRGVTFCAHRIIWMHFHGQWPSQYLDHINGDSKDNRIDNLRLATHTENRRNTLKYKNNSTGYKGVCFNKRLKRYTAHIRVNKILKHLGVFDTALEAAKAYDDAALLQFGDFACINLGRNYYASSA